VLDQWQLFYHYIVHLMAPSLPVTTLKFMTKAGFDQDMIKYEKQDPMLTHEFSCGILLVKPNQKSETDWFGNNKGSYAYDGFLRCLGETITLKDWFKYTGGLDTEADRTGKKSVYAVHDEKEIMFHIATWLPEGSDGLVARKRFLGNNLVLIVYQEIGSERFDPSLLPSQFIQVIILIKELPPSEDGGMYRVRISVCRLNGEEVAQFGPHLPYPPIFKLNDQLKTTIHELIISGHLAAASSLRKRFAPVYSRMLRDLVRDVEKSDTVDETAMAKQQAPMVGTIRISGLATTGGGANLRQSIDPRK